MDDAARRAREIACTCEGHGGHAVGYCPLALIGPAADALVTRIATVLREFEAERKTADFTWRQVQPALEAAQKREHALTTRLSRVEAALRDLLDASPAVCACQACVNARAALTPDATPEGT